MQKLTDIIQKQKIGAQSAPMLGIDVIAFDQLAKSWESLDDLGFQIVGVPFRKVIQDQFLIQRVTVIRTETRTETHTEKSTEAHTET
jgi:hypothetical protein